jgi:hypothetical protein
VYLFACRIKIKTGWFFLLSIKNYFFGHLNARKHPKKILCYKRYENSRDFLDEKAKYQPWIIKRRMEGHSTSKIWMNVEIFSFFVIFYVASLASPQI